MSGLRLIEHLILDTLKALLWWPIWWYSTGLLAVWRWYGASLSYYAQSVAVGVWIKNLFVPMFGQTDWQSRIMSFMVRVGNIIVRGFGFVVYALMLLLAVIAYLLILPALLFGIFWYVAA